MKLKVQGWVRLNGYASRVPMPAIEVDAPDGVTAAREYAKLHGVQGNAWWNAGPSPQVVIRTEEIAP